MIWTTTLLIKKKPSPVGNMSPIVVLDACTILNLLRIDDESDFLLKQMKGWRLYLPEMVHAETKRHVQSSFYPKEKNDHIFIIINQEFGSRTTLDRDIKKDLDDDEFSRILRFSSHNKRENGELFCVALALIKSRIEEDTVTLYTDDYKAKEEFQDYYHHHRIGDIGDTLDLLTTLYWSTPENVFQNSLYRSFLENLRSEFNHQLHSIAKDSEAYLIRQKNLRSTDNELLTNLNHIVEGYHSSDISRIDAGVRFFQEGHKYNEVKKIIGNVDPNNLNQQAQRVSNHIRLLKKYPIFKLA